MKRIVLCAALALSGFASVASAAERDFDFSLDSILSLLGDYAPVANTEGFPSPPPTPPPPPPPGSGSGGSGWWGSCNPTNGHCYEN